MKHSELLYGSDAYNVFRATGDTVASLMSPKQCEALFQYTATDFKLINCFLNGNTVESSSESLKSQVEVLDSVFSTASKLPDKVTVLRAELITNGVPVEEVMNQRYPVGCKVIVKQFLSTSLCSSVPTSMLEQSQNGFMVAIETSNGVVLNDATSAQGLREREVLLKRDTQFVVNRHDVSRFDKAGKSFLYPTVYLTAF